MANPHDHDSELLFTRPIFQRSISRRRLLLASGVMSASALLAACGGDDEESDTSNGGEATSPASDGEATSTTSTIEETPSGESATEAPDTRSEGAAGGTLRIAVEQNPVSLDPAFIRDVGSTRAVWYLYDSLLDRDENDEVVPWLAESWEMAPDGTMYTLSLTDGVTFHDGTPLNAEAVKFSFERLGDAELESRFIDDYPQRFSSVEATDDLTVTITTPTFYSGFIDEYLANDAGHVVSPTAAGSAGKDFALSPVGSGPFKFSSFEPDSALELERFDEYWGGTPLLDAMTIRIIPEQGVQIVELEAGNIDVSFSVQAKDVKRLEEAGVDIFNAPPPTAAWVSMNLAKGLTQELAVRKAISLAMNREAIVSELLLGYGVLSYGGTPKGWPRYHEEFQPDPYDLEEAGRILDEAGWVKGSGGIREKDGQPLKVNVLSTQLERALSYGLMNQFIQQQLTELGFDTEIQTQEWGAYLDEFRAGTWWEVTFHAQNFQTRDTVGANLDPDAYWNVNQHAKATVPELVESADTMRDIYARMESEVDTDKRLEIWKEAQTLCAEQMLVAWLVHWDMLIGHQSRVKGLTIKPVMADTLHNVHKAWIEE